VQQVDSAAGAPQQVQPQHDNQQFAMPSLSSREKQVDNSAAPPVEPQLQRMGEQPARAFSSMPAQLPLATRKRGLGPLIMLLVLVLVLLVAGVSWIALASPFGVSPVTKPLQSYRDTHLGFALSYPSDWTVIQKSSSTLFSDSTQTAQVTMNALPASNVSGGDIAGYVQKQVAKAGMTGAKTVMPISFAGTTWQQVQGGVQVNGVSETETVFATIHNNQLFLLMQTAPQVVYGDEENIVFSKMRASLQLL
jgi:hypothetical protein